ncbi:PAS/PAC sensor signal transduction histidine kinase [Nodularia sp. NIES-3585]|nr:PAS/PAC sensor signal transduction histidine kinase [Nodularia sp. NIES-3585]
MNAGNYKLAQFSYPLKLQPEANLKFAHLLVSQYIRTTCYLVETAQFIYFKGATFYQQVKYFSEKFLFIRLKIVAVKVSLSYWLKIWQNSKTKPHRLTLILPRYFIFKCRDDHRTQEIKYFCSKLPFPT